MKRIKLLSIFVVTGLIFTFSPVLAKDEQAIKPLLQKRKVDLTVTNINFSSRSINKVGKMSVTIKNVGNKSLTSTQGILNTYFNLPSQQPDWQFYGQSSPMNFLTSRPLPSANNPLLPGESISFVWLGQFTEAGNYYIHYKTDNANELNELNENNNSLSTVISIN